MSDSGTCPSFHAAVFPPDTSMRWGCRDTSDDDLRVIVAKGGALPRSSLATWPTQAAVAIKGDWNSLAAHNKSHHG